MALHPDFDFRTLEGHQQSLDALRKGGRRDPFPSLVFDGPSRIGKRLAGVWYAAFLNCLSNDADAPCGICNSCKKILSRLHPDLHFTRVPEKKTVVGVSEVREAIHEVHHAPFEGNFRVWVIEEGERLSDEAQNALLKTLEEPPGRAVIVLVTNLGGTLLPTVSSRCRLVRFQALTATHVERALQKRGAGDDVARSLAALCGGSLGAALSLLADPSTLHERESVVSLFSALPGQDLWAAVETAQRLEKAKFGAMSSVLDLGLSFYRDLLILSAGSVDLVVHKDRMERLQELAGAMPAATIRGIIRQFQEADNFLQRNVSPRLLMQRLCINVSKAC
jgi:DNA polymerase III subunit delta'